MKVFHTGGSFAFSATPFPAFRSEISYGKNKRDFSFLPCNAHTHEGKLIDDYFKIIKTREKGTLLIVEGEDKTDRALLFCGISNGFRGSSGCLEKTANIICESQASNACEGESNYIVLLEKGQHIALYSKGRKTDSVTDYLWDGVELKITHFERSEWNVSKTISNPEVEGDEI